MDVKYFKHETRLPFFYNLYVIITLFDYFVKIFFEKFFTCMPKIKCISQIISIIAYTLYFLWVLIFYRTAFIFYISGRIFRRERGRRATPHYEGGAGLKS